MRVWFEGTARKDSKKEEALSKVKQHEAHVTA